MQNSFGANEEEKKRTLLAMLTKMALVDGFEDMELEFIRNIGKFLKLDPVVIDESISKARNHDYDLPKTEGDRLTFFFHIIAIMKVDKKIAREEVEVAKELGFQLGLRPAMTEELLDLAAKHKFTVLPDHEVPKVLSKYLN